MRECDLKSNLPKGFKSRTRFAREDVGLCPFYGSTVKECNLLTRSFCSIRFYEITSFSKICNEIMYHSMLPLINSCTSSWNFAWHLLWRSTTESKNIVKLLAISQTIHTECSEEDYFPKGNFELFNSLFHSGYLVFPKSFFLLPICLPCVIFRSYVTKINAVLWHSARQTFASLGLFTFACFACLLQLWIKTSELNYSIWATPK